MVSIVRRLFSPLGRQSNFVSGELLKWQLVVVGQCIDRCCWICCCWKNGALFSNGWIFHDNDITESIGGNRSLAMANFFFVHDPTLDIRRTFSYSAVVVILVVLLQQRPIPNCSQKSFTVKLTPSDKKLGRSQKRIFANFGNQVHIVVHMMGFHIFFP